MSRLADRPGVLPRGNSPDTFIMEWLPSVRFISMMKVSGKLPLTPSESDSLGKHPNSYSRA